MGEHVLSILTTGLQFRAADILSESLAAAKLEDSMDVSEQEDWNSMLWKAVIVAPQICARYHNYYTNLSTASSAHFLAFH
jgi:hypothetical protein